MIISIKMCDEIQHLGMYLQLCIKGTGDCVYLVALAGLPLTMLIFADSFVIRTHTTFSFQRCLVSILDFFMFNC